MSPLDPVCGMQVDSTHAAGRVEYRGETYQFCSHACLEQFKRSPEQFVDERTGDRSDLHRHT